MCKFKKPEIPANITADERRSLMFNALSSLDLNDKLEKRENDKLSYLSWANAWAEFKAAYPSATYRVIKNPENNLPYFTDPNVGIMVFTEVTVDDLTHSMWACNGLKKQSHEANRLHISSMGQLQKGLHRKDGSSRYNVRHQQNTHEVLSEESCDVRTWAVCLCW